MILDKVLGMDCLTTYDATVDCFAKIVKIHILISQEFVWERYRIVIYPCLFLAMRDVYARLN